MPNHNDVVGSLTAVHAVVKIGHYRPVILEHYFNSNPALPLETGGCPRPSERVQKPLVTCQAQGNRLVLRVPQGREE